MHVESEVNLGESLLSFIHMSPGDQTCQPTSLPAEPFHDPVFVFLTFGGDFGLVFVLRQVLTV